MHLLLLTSKVLQRNKSCSILAQFHSAS